MLENVRIKAVESYMDDLADKGIFNGTFLLGEGNKILFKKSYGYANFEWKVKNTVDTKFKLASITKQFTGGLIILLAQEGLLKFEDKISLYIDNTPKKWKEITIHQLLTNTSGILNFQMHKDWESKIAFNTYKPSEFLPIIFSMKQLFKPGKDYRYSNSGYYLLGIIIERVTGLSYEEAMKKYIFQPLKMTNSGLCNDYDVLPNFASGYTLNNSKGDLIEKATYDNMSIPFSAGGLYSTVEDLFKWSQGLEDRKFLKPEYYKHLSSGYKCHNNMFEEYTYGWEKCSYTSPKLEKKEFICHNGVIPGYNGRIDKILGDNITLIFLSNVLDRSGMKIDLFYISAQVAIKLFLKNRKDRLKAVVENKVRFMDANHDVTLVKTYEDEIFLSRWFEDKKEDAPVYFNNKTGRKIKLYFLDIYGSRVRSEIIEPDTRFNVNWMTVYVIWELTDEEDNSLGYYKIHRPGELTVDIVNV